MNDLSVSIIIVNFHSLDLISDCVESIIKFTSVSYEIIVISNSDEKDSEINTITKKHPRVSYLSTGSNLGFAKANNIGAQKASGDFLFFLNPDTVLLNNAIDLLYQKISQSPEIGLIAPAVFDSKGNQEPTIIGHITPSSLISLALPIINFFISPKNQGRFYTLKESEFVDVVHGSSMLISSPLFTEVGAMNEDFFLYCEERDLCLKVEKANYKVYFFNKAKLEHIGGGSSKNLFLPLEIEKHRSRRKFIQRHHSNLVFLNRISGILGYAFRVVLSVFTFNRFKIKQFGTLFYWYLFVYK